MHRYARRDGWSRVADPLRGIRRLAWAGVASVLLLIAMGGAVRATDSGLACPDWPACFGRWIPPADLHQWLEHSHRLWAGVIGLLVAALTVWTFLHRRRAPQLFRLSLVTLLLVLVQSGLGAAVVLLRLRAGLVTSHLGLALIFIACLIVIAVGARPDRQTDHQTDHQAVAFPGMARITRWAKLAAGAVFLQALLGGQATGRGAAYVFNAVPIWLADDVWTGHIRQVLHVTHRTAGYLVATAVITFAVAARRQAREAAGAPAWSSRLPLLAAVLVCVQVLLGLANVLTEATVWSAIGHLAVASWLWSVLVVTAALGSASTPKASSSPASSDDTVIPDRTEVGA